MSKIVKIKSSSTIEDENWLEIYTSIKEYTDISDQLNQEQIDGLNKNIADFRELSMKLLDTKNHVSFAEIDGVDNAIALVELDYTYTGENIVIKKLFEENDEYFVAIEDVE